MPRAARTGRYISRAFVARVSHMSDHAERLLYKRISGICELVQRTATQRARYYSRAVGVLAETDLEGRRYNLLLD